MSSSNSGIAKAVLGIAVKKTYALVVETKTLFTVSGLVLITSIVGKVTTAITVANTVKLQANPTVGTTQDIFAATDIGTTDTPAGDLIGVTGAPADGPLLGIGAVQAWGSKATLAAGDAGKGLFVTAGTIEQVTATGADGTIDWWLTYVAIEPNASVIAA